MDQPNENTPGVEQKNAPHSLFSVPAAIVLAGVIIGLAIVIEGGAAKTPDADEVNLNHLVDYQLQVRAELAENMDAISENDHIRGNPDAAVYFIEYSDIECPFCKSLHDTLLRLMDEYGKEGNLAWVYRHFPIERNHPTAATVSHATECVAELSDNETFWKYLDQLFVETPQNTNLDLDRLPEIAVEHGIDLAMFEECMESERHVPVIARHLENGANSGVQGTPYNIIMTRSGKKYPVNGAQPYEIMRSIVELALSEELGARE